MSNPQMTAAILAGGRNRRLAQDKALLPLGDKPMIMHAAERARRMTEDIVIVAPEAQPYKNFGIPVEVDRHQGIGALAGLETALLNLSRECLLLLACDMPFVEPAVVQLLLDEWDPKYQAVAFRIDGIVHTMPALYRRDALFAVERLLARREYEIHRVFQEMRIKEVGEEKLLRVDPDMKSFVNLNTLEAYKRYALEAEGKPPLSFS